MRATTKWVATLAVFMAFAVPGMANTISIGLQQAGVNGGAIITEATGNGNVGINNVTYGTFTVNNVDGIGAPNLPGAGLDSNSINISSNTAGTLTVYVTETGVNLTSGLWDFLSSFTSNSLPSGWTATLLTYFDQNDVAYGTTTALGSQTFTAPGIGSASKGVTVAGSFSETEVFEITSNGSGNDNLTIDMTAAEPTSAALLLVVMGAGGLLLWKRPVAA